MCIHMSIANTNKIVSMKATSVHTVPLWPLVNVGTGPVWTHAAQHLVTNSDLQRLAQRIILLD